MYILNIEGCKGSTVAYECNINTQYFRVTLSVKLGYIIIYISIYSETFLYFIKLKVMVNVKVKVKFTIDQATKARRGSRGIPPLFL